jgi:hypothetical protein
MNVEIEGNKLSYEHVRGSIVLLLSPASTPPGARSARRSGTSPRTPTTWRASATTPT